VVVVCVVPAATPGLRVAMVVGSTPWTFAALIDPDPSAAAKPL
jgi:hypothetical protein